MNRKIATIVAAAALVVGGAGMAQAAVTVNPDGTGFVGKGDIQTAFGWNNKQLQANFDAVQIEVSSSTAQTTEWICLNERNLHEQERERTTTTTTQGVVEVVARERNQITGFNLLRWDGDAVTSSETEGPQLQSCPNANSSFVLGSTVVGDPEVVGGGVYAVFGDQRVLIG